MNAMGRRWLAGGLLAAAGVLLAVAVGAKDAAQVDPYARVAGGLYDATPSALSDGESDALRLDSSGRLRVKGEAVELAAGASVDVTNLKQWGGTAVTGGAGAATAGSPRVILASDDQAVVSLGVMDDWDEANRAAVNLIVGQAGITSGSGASGAGTIRVMTASDATITEANSAAIRTAVEVMDDWDESDRAKVNLVAGQAGAAAGTGVDAANALRVTLATNVGLPAGSANIGDVDIATIAAGDTNIGNVDIVTVNGQAPAFGAGVVGAAVQRVTVSTDDVVSVDDNAGSLTVDAPVGTPLAARLSDGVAFLGTGVGVASAALRVVPANDSTQVSVTGTVAVDNAAGQTVDVADAGGSLTVDAPVGTPVAARLSDGSAFLGTGTGVSSAALRVVTAADATITVTQAGNVNIGTFPDNEPFNVAQWGGTAVPGGSGIVTAGSPRVVLATDVALPAGTNNIGDIDVLSFPDNEPFNVAQINGVAPTMGSGAAGTGTQRVILATDQPVVPVSDNAGSLTVDAPVGTPVAARLSDGSAFYDGAKTGQLPTSLVNSRLDVNVGEDVGAASVATGQVNVSSSAVEIVAARARRRSVTITNLDATVTIWVGPSGVSATTGHRLTAGQSATFPSRAAIFAIRNTTDASISYWEDYQP